MKVNVSSKTDLAALAQALDGRVYFQDPPSTGYGRTVTPCNRPPHLTPLPLAPAACPVATAATDYTWCCTVDGAGFSGVFNNLTNCHWNIDVPGSMNSYNVDVTLGMYGGTAAWVVHIVNETTGTSTVEYSTTGQTPEANYAGLDTMFNCSIVAQ